MEMVAATNQLGTKQDTEIAQFFLLDFPALVFLLRTEVSSSTNFLNNLSEKEVGKTPPKWKNEELILVKNI